MKIRIGINGFGRIGKLVTRAALMHPDIISVAAINDPFVSREYIAYLLKYDSIHGQMPDDIQIIYDKIVIGNQTICIFAEKNPENIPWKSAGAEIVAEATGVFCTEETAMAHIRGGAEKAIITAPAKDSKTPTFVFGVNSNFLTPDIRIASGASCTTNCAAPLLKVISENFGIEEAFLTTVHSVTNTQKAVDAQSAKDWRLGRASSLNIIPSSTGAAKACALVLPELTGKITGMSFRVPTVDVSVVDITLKTSKATSLSEINRAVKDYSEDKLYGILSYNDKPLVSSDFVHDSHTSIYDSYSSMELNSTFYKLISWYDNEWGYSNKILELIRIMGEG